MEEKRQAGERVEEFLKRRVTRRQAIAAGGLAMAGLMFSKPLIETFRPTPAFANYANKRNEHWKQGPKPWKKRGKPKKKVKNSSFP